MRPRLVFQVSANGILPVVLFLLSAAPAIGQSTSQQYEFTYHDFDSTFSSRILVSSATAGQLEIVLPQINNAENTASLAIRSADFSQEGPWNSQLLITTPDGSLSVRILDHSAYPPSGSWINEKLLLVRIWWGRVVGTDAILDITDGSWVSREMFTASSLLESMGSTSGSKQVLELRISRTGLSQSVLHATIYGQVLTIDTPSESCSGRISTEDTVALQLALGRLENSRLERIPPCKPGSNDSVYDINSNSDGGAIQFRQKSSCLSVDPDFTNVLKRFDEIRQRLLPACSQSFVPETTNKKK